MAYNRQWRSALEKTRKTTPKRLVGGAQRKRFVSAKRSYGVKPVTEAAVMKLVDDKLKRLARGPPTSVQLRGMPNEVPVYERCTLGGCSYFRVPVTLGVPPQQMPKAGPDSRWRKGDKVFITGVSLRVTLSFSVSMEIMAVCYPDYVQKAPITLRGDPNCVFEYGVPHEQTSNGTRLLTLKETNLLNEDKEGPFRTVSGLSIEDRDISKVLDSTDQSAFSCRIADGKGAPIGTASWKKDVESKVVSTARTYSQQFHVASGSDTWDTRNIQVYFQLNREVEYLSSSTADALVLEPHIELLVGVRSMNLTSHQNGGAPVKDEMGLGCAVLRNPVVDIYYGSHQ
jgi:hypothetical protein